ncbi:MAG TPA: BMP family ABC transporter substrate-binding protein [Gaiellaceae bacterium]|nr:BMP family ABC transporter substrate-binding protein [Gaiellaceae bacterium]
MTRRSSTILLASALLVVALCTASVSGASSSATAGFKFGVILPTSATDLNWSQTMAAASRETAKQLGADLSMTDKVFDPNQARPLFDQLLGQDVKLIFAHSFSYAQLVKELAAKNTDTIFVVSADGEKPKANISISTYSYLETGYSQCWLAAKLSKSGVIGNVGASKAPYNTETNQGCRLGAKAANPKAKVLEAYTNDFVDQQKGREVGQSLLDRGADVLFVSGGTDSSLGALALCGARKVPCLSTAYDNRTVSPAWVVSSTYINWRPWLKKTINDIAAGRYKTFTYDGTIGNGGLRVTPFDGPSAKLVSGKLRGQFATMLQRLGSKAIKLPASTSHPGYR